MSGPGENGTYDDEELINGETQVEELTQTPRPNLLDIIILNGKWAQVCNIQCVVKYLENKNHIKVDWDKLRLVRRFEDATVASIRQEIPFSNQEYRNIYAGPDQDIKLELREGVNIFGEYERVKQVPGT